MCWLLRVRDHAEVPNYALGCFSSPRFSRRVFPLTPRPAAGNPGAEASAGGLPALGAQAAHPAERSAVLVVARLLVVRMAGCARLCPASHRRGLATETVPGALEAIELTRHTRPSQDCQRGPRSHPH